MENKESQDSKKDTKDDDEGAEEKTGESNKAQAKFDTAKEHAIKLEKEAEDLQSKADAAEDKAKAARATAKKLKKALGESQDDADDDQEFGVSKKAKSHSKKSGSKGPTGVSVVQFTIESKDKAERLTSELLSNSLIADSQIINNNYERSFMKYKKMV